MTRSGRCVAHFELPVFAMRTGITAILGRSGLGNQQLTNILLTDVTAGPLRQALQAIIAEAADLTPAGQHICDRMFVRLSCSREADVRGHH